MEKYFGPSLHFSCSAWTEIQRTFNQIKDIKVVLDGYLFPLVQNIIRFISQNFDCLEKK